MRRGGGRGGERIDGWDLSQRNVLKRNTLSLALTLKVGLCTHFILSPKQKQRLKLVSWQWRLRIHLLIKYVKGTLRRPSLCQQNILLHSTWFHCEIMSIWVVPLPPDPDPGFKSDVSKGPENLWQAWMAYHDPQPWLSAVHQAGSVLCTYMGPLSLGRPWALCLSLVLLLCSLVTSATHFTSLDSVSLIIK